MVSSSFTPATDIPDLSDKVCLVTGGSNGLGKETVKQLAQHKPAKVYLAARSKEKFAQAVEEFEASGASIESIVFLSLDLASLSSVASAAKQILAENERLDILINNAGVMGLLPALTDDGYEVQFATNHLGHAYLVRLLLPLLNKTAAREGGGSDVRIVNVTSQGEKIGASRVPFDAQAVKTDMATYHTYTRYGQSKFANILFTRSSAIHYPAIKSIAVHPGRVRTPLLDGMFARGWSFTGLFQRCFDYFAMVEIDEGVKNQLWAAFSPDAKTGTYYDPIGKAGGESKLSHSKELADQLWDWQEKEFDQLEQQQSRSD